MSPLLAHAGHWLTTVGFALAPLTVLAGVAVIALAERRRNGGESGSTRG